MLYIIFLFHRDDHCIFKQCDNGRCCCSIQMMLINGEILNATVWKGGESLGSKNISIREGSKLTSFNEIYSYKK